MHSERLQGLYSSSDVMRVGSGEENIVWHNSTWLGKLYIDCKMGREIVKWHYLVWGWEPVGGCNEHSKKTLYSIQRGEFLV